MCMHTCMSWMELQQVDGLAFKHSQVGAVQIGRVACILSLQCLLFAALDN